MSIFVMKAINTVSLLLVAGVVWFMQTPGITVWHDINYVIDSGIGVVVLTLLKMAYKNDQENKEIKRGVNLLMADLFERRPETKKLWDNERDNFEQEKRFRAKAG